MDTTKLKKFAQEARSQLITQVAAKLSLVMAEGSAARREAPAAVAELERQIADSTQTQVIEKVAHTWFNRFTALRFMDANGYTNPRAVTPAEGATRPEVLADAAAGHFDDAVPIAIRGMVAALLDGRTPSRDAQGEAYRLLLVDACNQWHATMPFMFEKIADYTELLMPDDLLSPDSILARLRAVMSEDACQDVEIIGWLYQFYISEKKDQVFAGLKKNVKVNAENIPAATQLFTPHWIVRYLVENSLGRLWLLNRPGSKLAAQMDYYIAPEEPETDFLRIARPEDIRICDPACGSGHMLTYAFDLLHAIYAEEGYEADRIPALILTHNLHGVEIDDRAGALAAFALVMKAAAKLGRRRFLRLGVQPNICVMQDVRFTSAEMQDVAAVVGRDLFTAALRETLGQFEQAKNFGSLIVPKLRDPAEVAQVVRLKDFGGDLLLRDVQERVLKVLEMAEALSPNYHVVVANPPYLGNRGMNKNLDDWAKSNYPESRSDLFAMFIERAKELAQDHGLVSMITMQSWMFLSSYEKMRVKTLERCTIVNMAHLGQRAFDSIAGAVVSTTAFILEKFSRASYRGEYIRLVNGEDEDRKSRALMDATINSDNSLRFYAATEDFLRIPGAPVAYWVDPKFIETFLKHESLDDVSPPRIGMMTTDNERFLRAWWEILNEKIGFGFTSATEAKLSETKWFPYNKGGSFRKWAGNGELIVNWLDGGRDIASNGMTSFRGKDFYFKPGITWGDISTSTFSCRSTPAGRIFDIKGTSCFPREGDLPSVMSLLNSCVGTYVLNFLNPTMTFQSGDIRRLPLVRSKVADVANLNAPQLIRLSSTDWDANETSWDFTTLPLLAPEHRADTLADSYATLRAHWQGMTDEMQRLEEENNRIFIDAYGLQDELTPKVPLEEITLTCNPAYRYGGKATVEELETRLRADTMAEFLHYAVGCMFGRYSLDAPGLILANQGEGLADYLARIPEPTFTPDADNVIPVLDGDWFADDIVSRARDFIRLTFGEAKVRENLAFVEAALGKDLRKWFTRDFFDYHVRRYKKRPIYWMFSSPKGSFNALIYMHRYRPDAVSVVLNQYLREYISKLEVERGRLEKLADDPTATPGQRTKALKEVSSVARQIDELTEWERDVVFPLAQAKIEIDLDDGVKRNYPKFGAALKPIKGLDASEDE